MSSHHFLRSAPSAKEPAKSAPGGCAISLLATGFFLLVSLFGSTQAAASGGGGEHGGGEHGGGGEGDAAKPLVPARTTRYVHQWLSMPPLTARRLDGAGGNETVAARPGRMLVIIFLASWCEPCQQLLPEYQALSKRFSRLPVDFIYVFAHDTKDDAMAFMTEFAMSHGYLANHELLKTYHNPELPTIYVGDRRGWLTARYRKSSVADLKDLGDFIELLTAL